MTPRSTGQLESYTKIEMHDAVGLNSEEIMSGTCLEGTLFSFEHSVSILVGPILQTITSCHVTVIKGSHSQACG
jgi:hypothetical protein